MLSEKSLLLGSLQEVGQFPAVVSTEGTLCVMPDCIWVTHLEEKQKEGCDSWLFMDVWMVVIVYNWLRLLRHSLFKFEYSTWNIRKTKSNIQTISICYHVNQEGLEVLCGFTLPELISLTIPLFLLSRPTHLYFSLTLLETCLDPLLTLLVWVHRLCVCVGGGGWYVCVLMCMNVCLYVHSNTLLMPRSSSSPCTLLQPNLASQQLDVLVEPLFPLDRPFHNLVSDIPLKETFDLLPLGLLRNQITLWQHCHKVRLHLVHKNNISSKI